MKDTIYTIPLTDAFHSQDECPFCFIQRKLEQDAISFVLGSSYMQDDIRQITDEMGFCKEHYKKMYDYGNKLGNAFILHTHYISLQKKLNARLQEFKPDKTNFFKKLTKKATEPTATIHSWIKEETESCYICNRIESNFNRYLETFFYLVNTNPSFRTLFEDSKGFCLSHFGDIMHLAEHHLKEDYKEDFYNVLFNQMQTSFKRIEEDLSWFIDKHDYQHADADWKNSKDAINRAMQKLSSQYVADPVFKEK